MFLLLLASALASPDIRVDVHGMIQARTGAASVEGDPLKGHGRVNRMRALLDIGVGDRFRGFVQTELVGGFTLLDARIDGVVTPWLTVSAGQAIVPYSRAWNTPLPVVALEDRSLPNNALSPGRRFGLNGRIDAGPVTAWVGVYDATLPADLLGDEHAPMGTGRVQIGTPEARTNTEVPSFQTLEPSFAVGAGFSVEPADGETLVRGTADATVHVAGFSALAEGFTRVVLGDKTTFGGSVQVGQFLVPERLAVHGRLAAIGPGVTDEDAHLVPELGLTGYLVRTHALVQLRARLGGPTASLRTGEVVLRGQLAF